LFGWVIQKYRVVTALKVQPDFLSSPLHGAFPSPTLNLAPEHSQAFANALFHNSNVLGSTSQAL
jgi:hypothetical protein